MQQEDKFFRNIVSKLRWKSELHFRQCIAPLLVQMAGGNLLFRAFLSSRRGQASIQSPSTHVRAEHGSCKSSPGSPPPPVFGKSL